MEEEVEEEEKEGKKEEEKKEGEKKEEDTQLKELNFVLLEAQITFFIAGFPSIEPSTAGDNLKPLHTKSKNIIRKEVF